MMKESLIVAAVRSGTSGCDQPFKEGNPGAIGIGTVVGDELVLRFAPGTRVYLGKDKLLEVEFCQSIEDTEEPDEGSFA